jgi:hypothetical protein
VGSADVNDRHWRKRQSDEAGRLSFGSRLIWEIELQNALLIEIEILRRDKMMDLRQVVANCLKFLF